MRVTVCELRTAAGALEDDWAGLVLGWAVDPEGEVVVTTSRSRPFATVDVDLAAVEDAKRRYPRYVPELARPGRRPAG